MELDELKKSWNQLDRHLQDKLVINEAELSRLIQHTNQNVRAISRFNNQLRIVALVLICIAIAVFLTSDSGTDLYFTIVLLAAVPAIGWDLFAARYLSATRIDELPISTVILRFNKLHRWILRERIIGLLFLTAMIFTLFFHFRLWEGGPWLIALFAVLCLSSVGIILWIYRKNLRMLHYIKKNLSELKELKS